MKKKMPNIYLSLKTIEILIVYLLFDLFLNPICVSVNCSSWHHWLNMGSAIAVTLNFSLRGTL